MTAYNIVLDLSVSSYLKIVDYLAFWFCFFIYFVSFPLFPHIDVHSSTVMPEGNISKHRITINIFKSNIVLMFSCRELLTAGFVSLIKELWLATFWILRIMIWMTKMHLMYYKLTILHHSFTGWIQEKSQFSSQWQTETFILRVARAISVNPQNKNAETQ